MNPSDAETSDSSSSSNMSAGSRPESACPSTPRQENQDDEEGWSSVERSRRKSVSPTRLPGGESSGEPQQKGSDPREGFLAEQLPQNESVTGNVRTQCSAETHASAYISGDTRLRQSWDGEIQSKDRTAAQQDTESPTTPTRQSFEVRGPSPESSGDETERKTPRKGVRRQRPLSAPPKAFPYARHLQLPSEKAIWVGSGTRNVTETAREIKCRQRDAEVALETTALKRGEEDNVLGTRENYERKQMPTQETSSWTVPTALNRREREKNANDGLGLDGAKGANGGAVEGVEEGKEIPLSSQDFGLHRWKEYAVLRHGGNRRFTNSQHGREILFETAATIRAQEVEELKRELKETRALAEELHNALSAEQAEKFNLQSRNVVLEREVEGMKFARRRRLKDNASSRGRGSNFERRLAGNAGNLRTFLFGAAAKADVDMATTPAVSPVASISRPSITRSRSPATSCCPHSATGGAMSATSSAGDEEGDGEEIDGGGEGDVVRRVRETAELEKSELRRRHDVEMSAKKLRIEKMKLEIKKLEAERDGLRKAAKTQAELFSGGYAELKACLEEIKSHPGQSPGLPDSAERGANPVSLAHFGAASGAAVNQDSGPVGMSGGDGGTIRPAQETHACVKTMLATEEGLNHQVQTLQSLLLEAVAAAVPTVIMPPAVTVAVDSIREGMGLPSLAWAPGSHNQPSICGSTSLTLAVGPNEHTDSTNRGIKFKGCETRQMDANLHVSNDESNGLSSQPMPCQRAHGRPPSPSMSQARRSTEESNAEEKKAGRAVIELIGGIADGKETGSMGSSVNNGYGEQFDGTRQYENFHEFVAGGDNATYEASDGSGSLFPPVVPFDDDSEEEDLETEFGHHQYGTTGWRRDGQMREQREDVRARAIETFQDWFAKNDAQDGAAGASSTVSDAGDIPERRLIPHSLEAKIPFKYQNQLHDDLEQLQGALGSTYNRSCAEMTAAETAINSAGLGVCTASRRSLVASSKTNNL